MIITDDNFEMHAFRVSRQPYVFISVQYENKQLADTYNLNSIFVKVQLLLYCYVAVGDDWFEKSALHYNYNYNNN